MIEVRCKIGQFLFLVVVGVMFFGFVLAGESTSNQAVSEEAKVQSREFLNRLAEKKDSPGECFNLLKRRLLEGYFEDVKKGLDMRDESGKRIFAGYRFARLRARCARVIFLLYVRRASPLGLPSEQEGADMRRLGREATSAYEEAFGLADSDFERACVYARWHELHASRRFDADSLLLRSGSPLERSDGPIDEGLSKQLSLLRIRVSQALDSVKVSGKALGDDAKKEFVDVFVDEYGKLARIGVAEAVFSELLEDIEGFLHKGIHPRVLTSPQSLRMTIRYHIWYALTGYRADELDNKFIDDQIKRVEGYIRAGFSRSLSEYEDDVSKVFLELAELERGNRLIPGLKRPLWPYEWSQGSGKDANGIEDEIVGEIDKGIGRMIEIQDRLSSQRSRISSMSRFGTPEDYERKMEKQEKINQEETASSIRSVAGSLMSELNTSQRIGHGQYPPGVIVTSSGGTVHEDSGIMVYTVGETEPVPEHPWKKAITPIDSSTKSTR
jgi:hypothetical protein